MCKGEDINPLTNADLNNKAEHFKTWTFNITYKNGWRNL